MTSSLRLLFETLRSLTELARLKNKSPATTWRWSTKGCRGVILETVIVGGRRYSTDEAFLRFAAACSAGLRTNPAANLQTTSARQRAHEQAERELDDAGL